MCHLSGTLLYSHHEGRYQESYALCRPQDVVETSAVDIHALFSSFCDSSGKNSMIMRTLPAILSCLLLGAHFLRYGNLVGVGVCLLLPATLLIRNPWGIRILQAFMGISAVIWVQTTVQIVRMRIFQGRPWGRTVLILGIVTVFTIFSGFLLQSKMIQERYFR